MCRRIVLLLAVAALMTLMVVAPASAQVGPLNNGPLIDASGNTVDASDTVDVNDNADDATVQCLTQDPLVDTVPNGDLGGDDDTGDQCADDGGTNEDNEDNDTNVPTFPFP